MVGPHARPAAAAAARGGGADLPPRRGPDPGSSSTSRGDRSTSRWPSWPRAGGSRTLDDALDALDGPTPTRPRDPVVVTFDDGTADFADAALPDPRAPPDPGDALPRDRVRRASGVDFPDDGRPLSWAALRDTRRDRAGRRSARTRTPTRCSTGSPAPADRRRARPRRSTLIERAPRRDAGRTSRTRRRSPARPPADRAVRARFRSAALAGHAAEPVRRAPTRTGSPARRSRPATGCGGSGARSPAGWASRTTSARTRQPVALLREPTS